MGGGVEGERAAHKLKPDALVEMNPVSEIKQLGREQNKARDWRDDVPFIRLCSGAGLPGCRHTLHSQPSVSDNNGTDIHQ